MVDYDDTGSIGKRYRRQDEIGTPFCITVDFQTVGDETTPRGPLRHRPGARHHGAGAHPHRARSRIISQSASSSELFAKGGPFGPPFLFLPRARNMWTYRDGCPLLPPFNAYT